VVGEGAESPPESVDTGFGAPGVDARGDTFVESFDPQREGRPS
jgi:hypothetical protein